MRRIFQIILALGLLILASPAAYAQIVTTSPSPLQTDSSPIVITFHANEGNKGLAGLGPNEAVYAHTGLITNKSTSDTDWQYAPTWLDNSAKYKLTYVSADTWQLTIPDLYSYFNVPQNQGIVIKKLMFVFRNATGSREGKTATGGDIAVEVLPSGFHVSLSSNYAALGVVGVNSEPVIEAIATADCSTLSIEIDGNIYKTAQNTTSFSLPVALSAGGHKVVAKARSTQGVEAVSDTLKLLKVTSIDPKGYPARDIISGAVYDAASGISRFCVAAPGAKNVVIVGSWNGYDVSKAIQLTPATQSCTLPADTTYIKNAYMLKKPWFWCEVGKLDPSKTYTYYYIIDGKVAVADPYSNLVLDPDNDRYIPASVFPDMPVYPIGKVAEGTCLSVFKPAGSAYKWSASSNNFKPVDKSRIVVYELLIRDFTGEEGKANASGTIDGVISKLDYIASLGVNAVEFMPIMELGGNNSWGYNPNFYFAPDKAYGTPDDYKRLFDECHKRNLAVILDVVLNQADSRHPWYRMYSPAENPFFNGSAPHSYSVLNDWNQDNPLVARQWNDMLTYWMEEYRVDGFRFDLVKGLGDNGSYNTNYNRATNTFSSPSEANTNRLNQSRVARMKKLNALVTSIKPDAIFINEDLAEAGEENLMGEAGMLNWANINNSSCQFAMGYSEDSNLNRFYAPADGGRLRGSTMSYAESHDEQRMAYKQTQWGVDAVKKSPAMAKRRLGSVAAQMLLTPGAHMIWQFQELGDAQNVKNDNGSNNTDPRKVVWSLLNNTDSRDLMLIYRQLMTLRNAHPELFGNDVIPEINCAANDWSGGRSIYLTSADRTTHLACAINPLTDKAIRITLKLQGKDYNLQVASAGTSPQLNIDNSGVATVEIQPGAFAVFGNFKVTGVDSASDDFEDGPMSVYTITGQPVKIAPDASLLDLPKGIYIVKQGSKITKIIR